MEKKYYEEVLIADAMDRLELGKQYVLFAFDDFHLGILCNENGNHFFSEDGTRYYLGEIFSVLLPCPSPEIKDLKECKHIGSMFSVFKLQNDRSAWGENKCSACGYAEPWQYDF